MSEPNKILEVRSGYFPGSDSRHPLNKFNFTIFSILTADFNIEHSLLNNIHRFSIFRYSVHFDFFLMHRNFITNRLRVYFYGVFSSSIYSNAKLSIYKIPLFPHHLFLGDRGHLTVCF